jgi:DNA-directed RNA polymerase subunit beta'
VLARVTTGGAKTKDITGGLPRVAELFEARRPKDHAIIAEVDGGSPLRPRLQEQAPRLDRSDGRGVANQIEYLVPKGKHLAVQDGDYIERVNT